MTAKKRAPRGNAMNSVDFFKAALGSVQAKLGARNRVEIAAWAWERRMVG